MRSQAWNSLRGRLVLFLKFGSVLLLFVASILIVACGSASANAGLGAPAPTLTINLNQTFSSPTPPLPPYSCAAWATESSPAYYQNAVVMVYAKYVQNVDGNPVGMKGAQAVATVLWPSGAPQTYRATASDDGLAVFPVQLQQSAVGHITLVSINFTAQDGQHSCNVTGTQDAFFTAVIVSPTPSPSASPTDNPSASPSATDTANPNPSPDPSCRAGRGTPTPTGC